MKLHARIDRLQAKCAKVKVGVGLALDLPLDLRARIEVSQAARTFPQSMADADLGTIVTATDVAWGQA